MHSKGDLIRFSYYQSMLVRLVQLDDNSAKGFFTNGVGFYFFFFSASCDEYKNKDR
jgi:hypothetical protein